MFTAREITARRGYTTVARTRGVYATGENKYFDTTKAATSLTASADWTGTEFDPATFLTLFVPVKGSAINERIGRMVKVKKVKVVGMISIAAQANQTVPDSACVVRLALVQDMQTNAAQMQGEQVFAAPGSASALNAVGSFQSLANFGRFRVLKDIKFTLQDPNISWDGTNMEQQGQARPFKLTYNFKTPQVVHFNATNGGTIADIVDHSWHVVANCSSAELLPAIVYEARVVYCE